MVDRDFPQATALFSWRLAITTAAITCTPRVSVSADQHPNLDPKAPLETQGKTWKIMGLDFGHWLSFSK
jgi:hypothetical protein